MLTPEKQKEADIAVASALVRAGIKLHPNVRNQPIDYIDPAPAPFIVQIPLVEYFERMTKLRTDRWQKHFLNYLQTAVEKMHIEPTWAEFHAEPQLGKTRGLSQIFPTWCFGNAPMFRYTLAMYNISRSTSHADVMIQIMRSQLYRDIFPNKDCHLPKFASKDGFMTNARRDVEGGKMDAQKSLNPVGLESGMTGSGTDWLTIDDPYKEPKDAWSTTMWDNLDRFWKYGVTPRLLPHTCVAAMFHRYSYDDFGGYLLNTGKFDYVRYATVADGPYVHDETGQRFEDPLGREPGEYICPERRPPSYYRDKFDDDKVRLSMFQGRPGRDEGDFFKVGMIGVVTDEEQKLREWAKCSLRARGWDHAASQGTGDKSAGGLVGFQPDETVIVADVFSDQLDTANRIAKQKEIARGDGEGVTVVVPEGLGADGKDNVFLMRQNLQGFNVVGRKVTNASPGSDAKKRRAYNFSIAVNSGRVKFLDGPWVERVKMLMRRFGNSISGDDEVDALADAHNHLYEEFHKGLVIKDFSAKNLQTWDTFTTRYGPKIPAHWTLYAALKIAPDSTYPDAGVIVAKAAENSGLKETLFVVDEYREYGLGYEKLFTWLDTSLAAHCMAPKTTLIWLHADSESYLPTIRQKLNYSILPFREDIKAGIVEANWYTQSDGKSARLYGLLRDADSLPALRQEASIWGFNEKGEPKPMAPVWDCLRMITYAFKTHATELTPDEVVEQAMPAEYRIANMLKNTGKKHLTDSQQIARSVMEQEVREKLKIPRSEPDWLEGDRDRDRYELEGGW